MAEDKRQTLLNECEAEIDKIQRAIDKLAARRGKLLIVSGKAFAQEASSKEFAELEKAGAALIEKAKTAKKKDEK